MLYPYPPDPTGYPGLAEAQQGFAQPLTRQQSAAMQPVIELGLDLITGPGTEDPLRRAALDRALRALRAALGAASPAVLEAAAAAPSDLASLAALAEAAAGAESDPLIAGLARAPAALDAIAGRAGGLLSPEQVAERLGIRPPSVRAKAARGEILAIPVGDRLRYPACQFRDRQAIPGLAPLLRATAEVSVDPWVRLDILLSPDDALGGATPLEALIAGQGDAAAAAILAAA